MKKLVMHFVALILGLALTNVVIAQEDPLPDLTITSLEAPASASTQEKTEVSWTVVNQGNGTAIGSSGYYGGYGNLWYDNLYLSTDNALDDSDKLLANIGYLNKPLAAGESYTTPYSIEIPKVPAGDYYLLLQADSQGNNVYESNEDNNINVKPITIRVPDLTVTSIQAPITVSPQQQIEISWTVKNQGNGDAVTTYLWTGGEYGWYLGHDIVYLSTDEQLDENDQQIASLWHSQPLASGQSYTKTTPVTISNLTAGTYYLLVKTDKSNIVYESDETNNISSAKLITITVPDLIPTSISAPVSVSTQQQVEISWTVKNQGGGPTPLITTNGWLDKVYLSTDEQLDSSDQQLVLGVHSQPLPAGQSYTETASVTIPNLPAGTYYLILKTDEGNAIYESDEANNISIAKPISIVIPDLALISFNAPVSASPQQQIEISWTVKNQGNGQAPLSSNNGWLDKAYISTDEQLDSSDQRLAFRWHTQPLPAGQSYTETTPVTIPNLAAGNYYLLAKADEGDYIYESSEWNNVYSRLITIGEKEVLSETASSELTLSEELLSQKAASSNLAVTGDLAGTFNFTDLEITKVNSGSFIGRGFTKGQWNATLEGVFYQGSWQGVLFPAAKERKIYLKAIISGSDAAGIIDGYLTESVPESGIYDQYHAIWKLNQLADKTVFVTLNLAGSLNYLQTTNYPAAKLNVLQIAVTGKTTGHYNEPIDTVLNHLRVVDTANPYNGQGCSIISYVTKNGSGEGWTFDELTAAGKISLLGQFSNPLLGIVSASLDSAASGRTLSLSIERIDLALPPAPELRVKVWGPQNVSPGQTVNYIIEYRNDGVKAAEEAIITNELPIFSEYISASSGVFYNELNDTLSWDLGAVPAKKSGYLSVQVSFPWGLPEGLSSETPTYINLIEFHSLPDNLVTNGVGLSTEQILPGVDNPDVIKLKCLASSFDATWVPVYTDIDSFESLPHVFAAMLGIPTEKNGLLNISGNHPKVLAYSGSTTSDVVAIEKGLVTTKELHLGSAMVMYQERLQRLSDKGVEKIIYYYSLTDDLINEPMRVRYSSTEGITFKTVVGGEEREPSWVFKQWYEKEFGKKMEDMIRIGEEIFSKNFNKVLKVKTFNIFSDKVGNQVELEMIDEQGDIFPLILPDGTPLPKPFYIQNDMKTGQPIKSEGIVEVVIVENVSHSGWISWFITKFLSEKIGKGISEVWRNVSSFFKFIFTTAHDPNELSVFPEGDVIPGQQLNYTVSYENEGKGIAYGVYVTNTLEEDLDEKTLAINNGGSYDADTRTISWFIGELSSRQKGSVSFSIKVKQDAPDKSEVINFATVYFPSVPEATRTNGTVNKVTTSIDNVPPITTASISPEANTAGWNNTDVSISLTAIDNETGSGVAKTEYSLDAATWITYTTSFTISSEGITTVSYKSTDNLGNIESLKTLTVKLDKTLPNITTQVSPSPNSFGWNNTDTTVTFSGSDSLSGIATVTSPVLVTTEGANQNIGGEAVDLAGNKATTYVILNIDKTPPTVKLTATPNTLWPPNHKLTNVIIGGSSQDNLSGIASNSFKVTDEYKTTEPLIPSFNSTIKLEAWREGSDLDGRKYTISVTTKDKAGNQTQGLTTVICPHDQRKK